MAVGMVVLVEEVKTAVGEMMERGGGSASNGGVGDKVSDDGERIVVGGDVMGED